MSCLAIWYSSKNKVAGVAYSIEAHFNLWRLKTGKHGKVDQFLDVGLMMEDTLNVTSVNIFVPFAIEGITDLGSSLQSTEVVQAVFNEPWYAVPYPDKTTIGLMDFDKNDKFRVHELNQSEWKVTQQFGGSVITLLFPIEFTKKTYVRFRIGPCELFPVTAESKPSNSWLESAFFVTETLDFHVNEERKLTDELLRAIHSDGIVKFTKMHLFLMRYDSYDYVFSYPVPNDIRTLEEKKWIEYIGPQYNCNHVVAYHWKRSPDPKNQSDILLANSAGAASFDDFSAFAKFRLLKAGRGTIALFIFILVIIGIVGSFIASCLFAVICSK